jgi:hypothetical protein
LYCPNTLKPLRSCVTVNVPNIGSVVVFGGMVKSDGVIKYVWSVDLPSTSVFLLTMDWCIKFIASLPPGASTSTMSGISNSY